MILRPCPLHLQSPWEEQVCAEEMQETVLGALLNLSLEPANQVRRGGIYLAWGPIV